MELGGAIRQIRKDQNLTIDSLASVTGLSRAYISQIENSKASPSIPTVRKICSGLGVSPAILFEDREASCVVIRADRRKVLQFESEHDGKTHTKIIHMLSEPNRKLEFALLELSVGHTAGDHAHPGEEIFFVLEGEITITHGEEEHILKVGDSVHIGSQRTHKLYNHGNTVARFLNARTPPGFIDLKHNETLKRADNLPGIKLKK